MTANTGKESIADVSRRLLGAAYPDRDRSWIEEQVALAGQRVGGMESYSSTVPAPVMPASTWGRRALLWSAGVVVLAAVVVVGITQREWFAETALSQNGVYTLIVGIVLTLTATIVDGVRARQRKILSCRVRIDARFDTDSIDLGQISSLRRGDKSAIRNPGVVVARIKNMGRTPIEPDDYLTPPRIAFPGREVVAVDVTESDPPDLADRIPMDPEFQKASDRILLPKVPLAAGHSFKLVVLLSGTEAGVKYPIGVDGTVRNGLVTTKPSFRRFRRNTIVGGALTALLAGALAVVLLLNNVRPFATLPAGLDCVGGSLTITGSSAFGLAATKSAGSYHAYCPSSVVDVLTPGSVAGVQRLKGAGPKDWPNLLALSDGRDDGDQAAGLTSLPLGVVPYTFVVNDAAPVTNLTLDQVRAIFTGRAKHWSDITGNREDTADIRVIGRGANSGTRRTLERYLLGGVSQAPSTSDSCQDRRPGVSPDAPVVCEVGSTGDVVGRVAAVPFSIGYADVPDVNQATEVKAVTLDGRRPTLDDIVAGYPFWTVEYLYSHGPLRPGTLSAAFAAYLGSPESASAMASFQYDACRDARGLCDKPR